MNWRIMGNTASLPRLIVLKRSITYPQMVRNLEQTKEKSMEKRGRKCARFKKRGEGEGKRGENIKDCILISFPSAGHYLPDFRFNSRGNVVVLKAQLLKVDSTSLATVLPQTFKESLI